MPTRLKPTPAPQVVKPEPLTWSANWSQTAVPPEDSTVIVSVAPEVASLKVSQPPVRPSCRMTAGGAAVPSSKSEMSPGFVTVHAPRVTMVPVPALPPAPVPALPPVLVLVPALPPAPVPALPPVLPMPPEPVPPTHWPAWHIAPLWQTVPQPPQLVTLVMVSTQTPLQVTCGALQPHVPLTQAWPP